MELRYTILVYSTCQDWHRVPQLTHDGFVPGIWLTKRRLDKYSLLLTLLGSNHPDPDEKHTEAVHCGKQSSRLCRGALLFQDGKGWGDIELICTERN